MRRLVQSAGAIGCATLLTMAMTHGSAASDGPDQPFSLTGGAVGGVRVIQTGQTLTFAFTEKNTGSAPAPEDLVVTKTRHVKVTAVTCVLPGGFAINPDGFFCEPGELASGQSASTVITTRVTGLSGQRASVTLCLMNENTGVSAPCRTTSVPIA